MNKALATSVSALLTASASYVHGFDTWLGSEGEAHVETGLDNGSGTSGYWFSADDGGDGGNSKIIWPVVLDEDPDKDVFDPIIESCGGICGTADLQKGSLTYRPFVSLGFNVAGSSPDGTPETADASDWGGICITYISAAAPVLELGLGDFDASIGYANPSASLPKSTAGTSKILQWSDFKQPSWYKGSTKIGGAAAAKQLVSIKFKIQADSSKYDFNICAIGPSNGGTCPSTCDPIIKEPASSSSAKSSSSVKEKSSSSSTPTSSSNVNETSSSSAKIQSSSSAKVKSSSSSKIKSSSSARIKSSSSKGSKQGLVSTIETSPIKTVLDHNELHVNTQSVSELKVNVFDVQGNLKMQYRGKAASSHLVSLKNLSQGTYLVQITSGIKTQIQQIVIK